MEKARGETNSARTISVADAKANFSALITRVQTKRRAVTILRRGVPVAQIVPFGEEQAPLYGSMRGTVREIGDIVSPTGVEWTLGDE